MLRLSFLVSLVVVAINAWDKQLNNEYSLNNGMVPFHRLFEFGKKSDEKLHDRIVCDSDECKFIAKVMKSSMNDSVDPCEDFYEYACGKWPDSELQPENFTIPYSLWSLVEDTIKNRMKEIKNAPSRPADPFFVRIMNKFSKTCMDTQSIEGTGLGPVVSALSRAGGWPMIMELDEWSEEVFPWQKVDDYYSSFTGDNLLYKIGLLTTNESSIFLLVEAPPFPEKLSELFYRENSTTDSFEEDFLVNGINQFYIQADSSEDNLKYEYEKDRRNKYANYITEVALAIARSAESKVSRERIKADAEELVKFMIDLYKIADVDANYSEPIWTLNELQSWYNELNPKTPNGKINWLDKVLNLVNEANINADGDIPVMLTVKEYVTKLVPLLDKTPSRTIVNYIHWNFLSKAIYFTTKEMRNLHDNWGVAEKEETEEDRQAWCEKVIDRNIVFNVQYIHKYYSNQFKEKVVSIFQYIKRAVEAEVSKSKWMDEEIRRFLLDKAENIKEIFGVPKWITNVTVVNNLYRGFVLGPTFFDNYYSYANFKRRRFFGLFRNRDMDISIAADALILNAYYGAADNDIEIPAGVFQSPLYDNSWPSPLKYGIMGAVLGHEINHGYDVDGRRYDKNGKLFEWLIDMVKEYNKRAECFVHQFDNYANQIDPDDPLENYGNKTLNENMCDTMGLEACYNAYKISSAEALEQETVLPGFEEFTSDQLLFLSYASDWCTTRRNETVPTASSRDTHSTGKLRTWGAVSNSKNFAKAFNCAVGTPMNPERKCNLWD